jgi:hypothetical protein
MMRVTVFLAFALFISHTYGYLQPIVEEVQDSKYVELKLIELKKEEESSFCWPQSKRCRKVGGKMKCPKKKRCCKKLVCSRVPPKCRTEHKKICTWGLKCWTLPKRGGGFSKSRMRRKECRRSQTCNSVPKTTYCPPRCRSKTICTVVPKRL